MKNARAKGFKIKTSADAQEFILGVLTETGIKHAEREVERDPGLVLCVEWIELSMSGWRLIIPDVLQRYGIFVHEEEVAGLLEHFMLAAMTRLDELTGSQSPLLMH